MTVIRAKSYLRQTIEYNLELSGRTMVYESYLGRTIGFEGHLGLTIGHEVYLKLTLIMMLI